MNPYKSAIKLKHALFNPEIRELIPKDQPQDHKIKPLKKFFRPSFSPNPNSWIVDIGLIEGSKTFGYLFFINENTRFLFAYPTYGKSMNSVAIGFRVFLSHFGNTECHIKGDGERSFGGIRDRMNGTTGFTPQDNRDVRYVCSNPLYQRNVKFFLKDDSNSQHLTFSYSLVDSVIRVMRNLTGRDFSDRNVFFQTVNVYNNTVHRAFGNRFTPRQVQADPELEMIFVRANQQRLAKVKTRQMLSGLSNFQPGNVLMIHIPWAKTDKKFMKQRRNFSVLASFEKYEGGNAVVNLFHDIPSLKTRLVLPLFYCVKVADNINDIDQEKYSGMI
jgi:hypothetical protein